MKRRLTGPLGHLIERHLKLRASLGFDDYGTRGCLYRFDRYLKKRFPKLKTVTRSTITCYLETIKHLHPRTRCNQILYIRQLCRFLFQLDPKTYIPERKMVPPGKTTVCPHIYTEDEVRALISLALHLKPAGSLRPHTYSTLLCLLWVSGIRIGEALKLNLQDVDLDRGILTIRETKFLKSRLVPLSQSTVCALSKYIETRNSYGHDHSPAAPLFINQRSKKLSICTVEWAFRKLTRELEMKTLQGGEPRLHDMRHAFATRWLADFYKSGKDPTAYLPILATYLGHASVAATQTYLHPSLELLERAGHRFAKYAST